MNSYRSLIIFLIMVFIIAAFWGAIRYFNFLQEEEHMPSSFSRKDRMAVTIHITERGFEPQHIEIMKDNVVFFVNDDIAPHWPVSDVHPTHTMCPGFDALRGLKQGETYRHSFSKSQTCSFHDHLNPSLTGSITIK